MAPLWPPDRSAIPIPDHYLASTVYFVPIAILILAGFIGCTCCHKRKGRRVEQCRLCSEASGDCDLCMRQYEYERRRNDHRYGRPGQRSRDRYGHGKPQRSRSAGSRDHRGERGRDIRSHELGDRRRSGTHSRSGDRRPSRSDSRGHPNRGPPRHQRESMDRIRHHPAPIPVPPVQQKISADRETAVSVIHGKGLAAQKGSVIPDTNYLNVEPPKRSSQEFEEKMEKKMDHPVKQTPPDAKAAEKRPDGEGIKNMPGYILCEDLKGSIAGHEI